MSTNKTFITDTTRVYAPTKTKGSPQRVLNASCCGPREPEPTEMSRCGPKQEAPIEQSPCCGPKDEAPAPKSSCCGPSSSTEHDPLDKQPSAELPVVVIGAGPVGLAAAANLVERGLPFIVLEAGDEAAASVRDWGHVRLFTPWEYLIDPAGQRLLERSSAWEHPPADAVPRGAELVSDYLAPLADQLGDRILTGHRVTSVSRVGHDRMKDGTREEAPFLIIAKTSDGVRRIHARAVIDASGTWTSPNPMGAGGVAADGELEFSEHVRYGMPDALGRERGRYAGKRVLVVGSGHSAIGSILALRELSKQEPDTRVAWAIRRDSPGSLWGGGADDELAQRGALGTMVHDAVESGDVKLLFGMSIASLGGVDGALEVFDVERRSRVVVDEIVVATGSRPDLGMLRELRLEMDLATESTRALGPLIDPNHHSCGSVSPHGAVELAHPERDFYIVGMKSYGRAPTFLLRTGYEQVRSVVAELAGDHEAARRVELVLPQTGVCSTGLGVEGSGGCC